MNQRGSFIVLYAANNLGKSEQAELLTNRLNNQILNGAIKVKYPIYSLAPTGPRINSVLRHGLPMTDIDLQKEYVHNRRDFEPELVKILERGTWVVAEDYKGTGIAWGVTKGISLDEMEEMNRDLFPEDLAILLDGERFSSGIERGHRFETGSDWEKARDVHRMLAWSYGWETVNANDSKEVVHQNIWNIVESKLL